jgi:Protein of unknown function (DUF3987)
MLLHEHGGRLAILSPEGGIFDLIAGRYSSTGAPNLDHVLKGHAGDPILVDRVGRPGEIIPRPALTIGLAVQPEVLRGLIARPGFHGRGLLARFLYAIPNTTLGRRVVDVEPVHHTLRSNYHRHIRALLALTHPTPLPLPLTRGGPKGRRPKDDVRAAPAGAPPFVGEGWGEGRSPASQTMLRGSDGEGRSPLPHPAATPGLPLSRVRERGPGGEGFVRERGSGGEGLTLPFDDFAADRLMEFAEDIEPRLAPDGDLDPIVDWASKLVGHTARIAGLIHLASLELPLPLRGGGGKGLGVGVASVDAAIVIAEYLVEHAKAAYAAMGLDPAVANVPTLLAWIKRTGRPGFTRRDARLAVRSRIRTHADLDEALAELEHHGYIRTRAAPDRPRGGRPSPAFDVHPSLVRR